jgi:hypothetical protein
MICKLRTAALLLTGSTALSLSVAAAGPASAAAARSDAHAAPLACTTATPIELNGFAFAPPEVTPGNSATADLITTNCSAGTLATEEEWTARWLPLTGTGLPSGCPVIDPLVRGVSYAPGQELAENTGYLVPVGCQAAGLAVTVQISLSTGASVLTATTDLKIEQLASGG